MIFFRYVNIFSIAYWHFLFSIKLVFCVLTEMFEIANKKELTCKSFQQRMQWLIQTWIHKRPLPKRPPVASLPKWKKTLPRLTAGVKRDSDMLCHRHVLTCHHSLADCTVLVRIDLLNTIINLLNIAWHKQLFNNYNALPICNYMIFVHKCFVTYCKMFL